MKKVISILALVILVSSCFQPVSSLFPVVWVDDSYPDVTEDTDGDPYFKTIAAAAAAVQAGGTINVAPGVYYGGVTLTRNDVTLTSREGAAVTTIDFTGVWCGYWSTGTGGIDIPYGVSGVTVEGFTVLGSSPASDALISIGGDNNTITHNIVVGDTLSSGQDIGIHIGNVGETSERLPSGNMILDNEVYNHAGSGIFVGNWAGSNNTVSGNTVHDNVVGGIPGLNGNGIEVDRALGVLITGNYVYNNEVAGIRIVRTAPHAVIEVDRTTITDNQTGILSENWRPGSTTTAHVSVNCCNIEDNTSGLLNTVDALIDARSNWWGSTSGPYHPVLNPLGTGDTVSDNVDFTPWGLFPNPCTPRGQGGTPSPISKYICPLARHNVEKAETLLESVQSLLSDAQNLGYDTTHAEELVLKARELLEKAKNFCRNSQNCIAGNTLALEAQNLLEEAQELLQVMLE